MRVYIYENKAEVAEYAAHYIVSRINAFNPTADRPFVMGFPTCEPVFE